ncbi:MAG: hypothetical protein E7041_03065 [Lentisphaerae bacterium]|nr:hypothetical protein [Lentisphaerota bacterium]
MKKILTWAIFAIFAGVCSTLSAAAPQIIPLPQDGSGWEVIRHENARGGMKSLGNGVFKITKANADGILEIRMKTPVRLPGKRRWFLRSEYQCTRSEGGTVFFFRLARGKDQPANMITSGSPTHKSETYLVNTPAGRWKERIYSIEASPAAEYYPVILVIGNPAEITVRNLHFDPNQKIRKVPEINARPPYYTRKEVDAILAKRQHATCAVGKDANGDVRFLLNGKPALPVMYKHEGAQRYERMFRIEDFADAGISFLMVSVPICHNLKSNEVVQGKDKYDFSIIDDYFYNILRRNPQAHLIVQLRFYEPYLGWARENWDELWQNKDGLRALGNNVHLKFFSNTPEKEKYPFKVAFWPSYSSQKWRNDYRKIVIDVMQYIMKQPYGKCVVGATLSGGDDGQFQYRKDDYSPIAMKAFHDFLRRQYGTLETMNKAWKTAYPSFEAVQIPRLEATAPGEVPFQAPGVAVDYRRFQEYTGWQMREFFASAVKAGAGKPVITIAYGIPDAFPSDGLVLTPSLDVIATPGAYALRENGCPYPMIPELAYRLYGKMWINEQDLRSWRAKINSELTERWMNTNFNIADWKSAHRKVLATSFASRLGWWYFSLPYQGGRFFDDPEIMAEIKLTGKLYQNMQKLPYRKFRPDVCLVADVSSNYAISAYAYAATANPNGKRSAALFSHLELTGVPYDRAYLRDILKFPELQQYKIYIFLHNAIISTPEREQIDKLLKKDGKTLIWVHSSGYLSEKSKDPANIQQLTGFAVSTDEKFARQRSYTVPAHPINNGVREVTSFGDLAISLQMPFGLKNVWGAPSQIFRLTDVKPAEVVSEDNCGNPTGAYRQFKNWNSLILTVPMGITPRMLNSIAAKAGAYRAGKAGHNIAMNGNFVSIHPMYDDKFTFITPPGVTELLDPETGKVIGKAPQITLDLTCGKTVWMFMR